MFSSSFSITLPNIGIHFPGIQFPGIQFPRDSLSKKKHFPTNKRGLNVVMIELSWTWSQPGFLINSVDHLDLTSKY